MEEMDIVKGLNPQQIEAVTTTEGRVRVIAGAGTGKTRVLTQRYIYLVNMLGIAPGHILCMTFTNKAAQEMKNRISRSVEMAGKVNDFICTIHSFCLKVLRRDIYRIGFPKTFAIIDEEDQKAIAREVFGDFGLTRERNTLDKFVKGMTAWKAEHKTQYIGRYMLPHSKFDPMSDKHLNYLNRQMQLMALDYNDIIHFAVYLLTHYNEVAFYWQNVLNYVMMDEAQDCNENDWLLMNLLTAKSHNLFVVGDPDQAIYEWRGAVPQLFVNFTAHKNIVMGQNYRSTPNILTMANEIIAHNANRIKKDLFTIRAQNQNAIHFHAKNEEKEAEWIATRINKLHEGGAAFKSMAVLYRSSYLSRPVEQALVKRGLPYSIWGGVRFFERAEIKNAIAYLKLICMGDDLSFLRIVNVPSRKLGKKFIETLCLLAKREDASLYNTLKRHIKDKDLYRKTAEQFLALIEDCRQKEADGTGVADLLDYTLRHSGLMEAVRLDGDEDRLENISELQMSVKMYEKENRNEDISLSTYLQEIALYTNPDVDMKHNTIKLMTIHQAKGLEFDNVFVTGLSEGVFPNARTLRERNEEGEEEERRLMYVAVTRARNRLYLSESEGFNSSTQTAKYPSRFLLETNGANLDHEGEMDPSLWEKTRAIIRGEAVEPSIVKTDKSIFNVGDRVCHKIFGRGTVVKMNKDNSYVVKFGCGERSIQSGFLKKEE